MSGGIAWINYLKAFGILAVIIGHLNNPMNEFIYSWHMPLFFILSGFFIDLNGSFERSIKKDFKRLMMPFFIFSMLAIVIESIKRWALNRASLDYMYELSGVLFWMDYEYLRNTYAFVLWFLPALFSAKILYKWVVINVKSLVLQGVVFSLFFLVSFYIQLPFGLSNALNAVLYIFLGAFLYQLLNGMIKIRGDTSITSYILFVAVVNVACIYLYLGVPGLNMSLLDYEAPLFNILWAFSWVSIFISVFKWVSRFRFEFVEVWGQGTMLLFILHPYTNNISHILVERLQFGSWPLKFLISLALLQVLLMIRRHFNNAWIFRYV